MLTATKIKQAKAQEKDYKLADEKGLFLLIKTSGFSDPLVTILTKAASNKEL